MLSRLFGSKKKNKNEEDQSPLGRAIDWSFVGTDIHSHLIPGIDDGAQTIEDSLTLIRQIRDMGFHSIVTTPHVKIDHYPNTAEKITAGLRQLQDALVENGINMPVRAAAEYYIDDHFMQLLDNRQLLPITGNEVLVELSFVFEPARFYDLLFKMQTMGYTPILAHPERYTFYHQKPNIFRELKDRGCLLQLNTIAISGYYGRTVKQVAEQLLKAGLYDYCGSDMHHTKHAEVLRRMTQSRVMDMFINYPFRNTNLQVG